MKYCLLSFLLMIGSAMGQTGKIFSTKPIEAYDLTLESAAFCEKTITMGNSSKAIKDIFPEECAEKADPPICYVGRIVFVGIEPKIPPCPPAEAPDVPAVKTKKVTQCVLGHEQCYAAAGSSCPCGHYEDHLEDTCADKSRILQIAEDGKKWCHKPVTK